MPAAAQAHGGTNGPASGAELTEVAIATGGTLLLTSAMVLVGVQHRRGQISWLGHAADRIGDRLGLPGWAALPAMMARLTLIVALLGMYWDISLHLDDGRDPGPLANPAHYLILFGLFGLFAAGFAAMVLPRGRPSATALRLGRDWHAPLGGVLMMGCGAFALAGFPLDDIWHRLFGQDVTLWGPTHLMLIGGASMSLIANAVLRVEGLRAIGQGPRGGTDTLLGRLTLAGILGGFLVGMSTFQAEFDFGVPQFRLVFQPVLIMLTAGLGLVAARVWGGPGAALRAVAFFLVLRGLISLTVGPGLGEATPRFPLYLAEAALVELVALRISRERPLAFATACGLLIGTVGLAAEWGWTALVMPLAWPSSLFPEAAVLGLATALAGALLGAGVGVALKGQAIRRPLAWRVALSGAALVVVAVVGFGLVTEPDRGARAQVTLTELSPAPERTVAATVRLDPASAGADADWLSMTSWQGKGLVVDSLVPAGPAGTFRTTQPIPVHGTWKALLRLHRGRSLTGAPVFLPADPAIPAPEVPATASFTRELVADKALLQREARPGATGLTAGALGVVLAISASIIGLLAWGLVRLHSASTEAPPPSRGATAGVAARPLAGAGARG